MFFFVAQLEHPPMRKTPKARNALLLPLLHAGRPCKLGVLKRIRQQNNREKYHHTDRIQQRIIKKAKTKIHSGPKILWFTSLPLKHILVHISTRRTGRVKYHLPFIENAE